MSDPKQLLIQLLSGVEVYDDEGYPVPGVVSAAWYDERIFKKYGWQITVGPLIDARARILDVGALHKGYVELLQVSVWVLRKRDANYTPERLRRDLIQEVDRILFENVIDPAEGFEYVNVSRWMDRDEPDRGILRSIIVVQVEYERERG